MPEGRKIIQSYQTSVARVNLRADGLTEIRFIEEYELDLPQIEEIQNAVLKIAEDQPLYILVVPGRFGDITEEARKTPLFRSERTKAIAVTVKHLHQRILGNLYFKFRKAEFSNYKMFSTIKKGEAWLLSEMSTKN